MLHRHHHGVLLIGALICGCGTIVELPVDDASTGASEGQSTSGSEVGEGTSQPDGTSSPITASDTLDQDTEDPTTGTTSEGSTSTGGPFMSIPICSSSAVEIPEDGTWLEAPIEVPAQSGVLDLDVGLRVQHPHVSQLRARVRAPSGLQVTLLDTPTCEGAGLEAVFDDEAENTAEDACSETNVSAIAGPVMPLESLGPLLADPVGGTWTIEITDATPGDTGTLDQTCIALTVEAR